MNVTVCNEQQNLLSNLDIDIIKNITGVYSASEIIEMFKNFFFNKMILDVTALNDSNNLNTYKTLASNIEPEKIICFIPEKSPLCTAGFLSALVSVGIYNFTTNIEGVKYLVKHSNTFEDVKEFQKNISPNITKEEEVRPQLVTTSYSNQNRTPKVIGVVNVTDGAGATTLIYMMKKELNRIMGNSVIALEIKKSDFKVFGDKDMYSIEEDRIKDFLEKNNQYRIILIDLNNSKDEYLCNDVIYLLEPSIIKINKLLRFGPTVLKKMKNKKVVLNKSLLNQQDVRDFQYESGLNIIYNIPPLNERKHNEVIGEFVTKLGLVDIKIKSGSSGRVFGLFRR